MLKKKGLLVLSSFLIGIPSNYYFKKDVHLNKEGNRLLSNKIIRYLKDKL